jgi:hypothetical protein
MRFSINIPDFGDFADARTVATVAASEVQVAYEASDTVLMLKSGTRSGGMTVRGK